MSESLLDVQDVPALTPVKGHGLTMLHTASFPPRCHPAFVLEGVALAYCVLLLCECSHSWKNRSVRRSIRYVFCLGMQPAALVGG